MDSTYGIASRETERIMSPFNKGESDKQGMVDPIWLHG